MGVLQPGSAPLQRAFEIRQVTDAKLLTLLALLCDVHLQDRVAPVPPVPNHIGPAAVVEPGPLQKATQHLFVLVLGEGVRPANANSCFCRTGAVLEIPKLLLGDSIQFGNHLPQISFAYLPPIFLQWKFAPLDQESCWLLTCTLNSKSKYGHRLCNPHQAKHVFLQKPNQRSVTQNAFALLQVAQRANPKPSTWQGFNLPLWLGHD